MCRSTSALMRSTSRSVAIESWRKSTNSMRNLGSYAKRCSIGIASIRSRKPIGWCANMLGSMGWGSMTIDIDAGSYLDELQSVRGEPEHTAFRDIEHALATFACGVAREGAMFNLPDEFCHAPLAHDGKSAVLDLDLQLAGHEGPNKHHRLGALRDVDETARSRQPRTKARHVEIAAPVHLGEPQKGAVKPAAIIEVELVGLVDDGLRIDGSSKVEARSWHAADDARFRRHGHEVADALFSRHGGYAFGHADAEVDHGIGLQFQRGAPSNDLALV